VLDYDYLFGAVEAITSEMNFNKLLETIMKSMMARLGAETGYLLISRNDTLSPYIRGKKGHELVIQFNDSPGFDVRKLSMGIARYVYRTKTLLIIDDAVNAGNFINDETVCGENLRSVLCLPLTFQEQVLGVMYLENSLISSVFSDDQVELVRLLTTQAAIALKNAMLLEHLNKANTDISALNKNLELRVEDRTRALKKANAELDDFAYAVSHDLKAPLRGITQLSSWLLEDHQSQLNDEGVEMVGLLKSRAKQLYDMIEGVLQYSRIGRSRERSERVDLNILVQQVADLLAIPPSISFKIEGTLPTVEREETQLFQVFQNIIDNAVKYMDKEFGEITVSHVEKQNDWQFCIRDNGPGIDEKYHQKVFKLFQTLQSKDSSDSTGIGLALVQKTISNWQGNLWLESDINKGSKFFFSFPKQV
jgi:signal transduction histidine kinase